MVAAMATAEMVDPAKGATENQESSYKSTSSLKATKKSDESTMQVENKVSQSLAVVQENIHPKITIGPLPGRFHMYIPPTNFGTVETGSIYRSGYPSSKNFDFITSLNIKTILTLVPEPLAEDYIQFMDHNSIRHYQIHIPANKDGNINITPEIMARALGVVLNRHNHPLLIHCNRGKHRTGCVTACFRKTQYMSNEAALGEYRDYASPKTREDDMTFIASFDTSVVLPIAQSQGWLPTPPPEPCDGFWHLNKPTQIPDFDDLAVLKPAEDHNRSPTRVKVS